jgi:glycoside/pentoside/hexuronide:cation symporter, GPH family
MESKIEANLQEPKIKAKGKREMSAKRLIGDGVGMFGINILIIGFYSVLSYYYTDVAGIAAGLVGTLILFSRIFDGFTDILMGNLIDKTKSKHGKARPWLLWLAVPAALLGVALFSVPDVGSTGKIIYILITNTLFFSIAITGIQVAYSSLMALTTKNSYDRSIMGIVRGVFGFFAGMIMSVAFIPVVTSMGNDQKSWSMLISIFAVIAAITILISFKSTKEIVSNETLEKESAAAFKDKFKALFKNKYLVLVLVAQIFATAIGALSASAGIYYAQYIWKNVNLVALIGGIGLLPMFIGFALMAPLVKRMGKRNVVIAGAIITIIGNVIRVIDPYSVPLGMAGLFIAGLGMVPTMTLLYAMLSDSIEYGEWKTGMRMEGLVNGSMNFVNKIGNGIGVAGIGWLLALGGYVAGQESQPALANEMIIAVNTYVPIILSIFIIIVFSTYRLDKEYGQVIADLESKKS